MINTTIIPQEEVDTLEQSEDFSDYLGVLGGMVNPDDVDRTLRWLTQPGETFEIRTFDSRRKPYAGTCCGYFRDVGPAVKAVVDHIEHFEPAQVYVTLNPVFPGLHARANDRIKDRQKNTTKDADIVGYRNILVDFDPVRPAGIPSSELELETAAERMLTVRDWLQERGFPAPLTGMSGNGYHLVYAVDLEASNETKALVKTFLEALASRFDDQVIRIDKSVHNPSRISKLYGTLPRKGDGADERVNRLARIIDYPDRIEVAQDVIQAVIDEIHKDQPAPNPKEPAVTPAKTRTPVHFQSGQVNLQKFLDNRGIKHQDQGGGKFVLDECVFNSEHNRGEVAVFQHTSGGLAYNCFHNSCSDNGWREFVQAVGRVNQNDFDTPLPEKRSNATCHRGGSSFADLSADRQMAAKEFPVEVLPDGMRQYVVEIADRTNAPLAIVGSAALGVLAASVQNVAVVKKRGWDGYQNLSLFVFCIAESAGGKSRGMRPVMQSFCDLQAEKEIEVTTIRQDNKAVVKQLQKQLEQLFKSQDASFDLSAQIDNKDSCAVIEQARQMQRQIDQLSDPDGGSCLVYDHTVEATLMQMTKTNERAASLAAESRFVDQSLGITYQTAGSPSLMANAWDGDTITNRRVSRGSIILHHPALTICNGIQPHLFHRDYLKRNAFADSGFLQRFLMVQPEGIIAAASDEGEIDTAIRQQWDQRIIELASMPVPRGADDTGQANGKVQPHVLTISKEGNDQLQQLDQLIVTILKRGTGTQHPRWRSWLVRMVSQVTRIAGLLHAYQCGTGFLDHEITAETVERAIHLGAYYKAEADRILNNHTNNEVAENAGIIREYITRKRLARFRVKELRDGLRRRIEDDSKQTQTQKIKLALDHLEEEGVVGQDTKGGKRGGWIANSRLWEVEQA